MRTRKMTVTMTRPGEDEDDDEDAKNCFNLDDGVAGMTMMVAAGRNMAMANLVVLLFGF